MTVTVKRLIEALQECKPGAIVGLESFDAPNVVSAKDVDKLLVSDDTVTLHTKDVSANELLRLAKSMAQTGIVVTVFLLR